MKLVVDIPEEEYELVRHENKSYRTELVLMNAVAEGTPLPKGHGRIGDLTAVMDDINQSINEMTNIGIAVDGEYLWGKLNDAIDNAPTIIEADKGSDKE